MNFLSSAKKRYSVRNYNSKRVEQEKLNLILEAGRVAPTAANYQPQRILVIQSEEGLAKIAKATNIFHAPLALIVCGDKEKTWVRSYDSKNVVDIDASIVTDHMLHEATELGLGSLWVCRFYPELLRKEFNIPENYEIVNILVIGYTDEEPQSPDRHSVSRKPLTETVFYETF